MDFGSRGTRKVEMAVLVTKKDGRRYAIVPEIELECFGWGADPQGAVERYRTHRNQIASEAGGHDWDDVFIKVVSDIESGYPLRRFTLNVVVGYETTRPEEALRRIGRYLIDLANGSDDHSDLFGEGIELSEEVERGADNPERG